MPHHTIMVIDDHPLLRYGFKMLLQPDYTLTIMPEFTDNNGLFSHIHQHTPRMIILDINVRAFSGIDFIKKLRHKKYPVISWCFHNHGNGMIYTLLLMPELMVIY